MPIRTDSLFAHSDRVLDILSSGRDMDIDHSLSLGRINSELLWRDEQVKYNDRQIDRLLVALRDLYNHADIQPCPHAACTPQNCAVMRAERLLNELDPQ